MDDNWTGLNSGDSADGHIFGTNTFATIQDGIDVVASPGTVHVAAGMYYENITLKDEVEVLGAGAEVTTIDGGGEPTVVTAEAVGPNTVLSGFTITGGFNRADRWDFGGGISVRGNSSVLIHNNVITMNTAARGGGIAVDNSSPTISYNKITENEAWCGGGISVLGEFSSTILTNNEIVDNEAETGLSYAGSGAGIFIRDVLSSQVSLLNNIIHGNSLATARNSKGGGVYISNSNVVMVNNTIAYNYARYGMGVYGNNTVSRQVTIINTIVWNPKGNLVCPCTNMDGIDFAVVCAYSDILDMSDLEHAVFSAEPMFVDRLSYDYHLQPGSPCIDIGSNAAMPGWLTTDFEGDPRIVDGDGDSVAVVDIGADEYYPDIRTPIEPISFGAVTIGGNKNKTTMIYNDGTGALTINSIVKQSGSDEFIYVVPVTPFDIAAGESQAITIRFAPTSEGLKSATFNVNSNDPDEPDVTFDVSGNGVSSVALRIAVTLQGRSTPPNDQWIIPVSIWLHAPGAPWTEVEGHGCLFHFETQTSNEGIIELMVVPGTYDIRVKGLTTLKNLASGVGVNPPGPVEVNLGTLIEGDVNDDNMVTGLDYSAVIMCFGYAVDDPTAPGPTPMCDFNNDGYVTGIDYSAVIMNFGLGGADIE